MMTSGPFLQLSFAMTNLEIEMKLERLINNERTITKEILDLINIAEARRMHLERGYPSLFEWLVKRFGYSEGAAHRRIQAARALRDVPKIGDSLKNGDLNLTTLAKTQKAFRAQEKISGRKLHSDEKAGVIEKLHGKSTLEAENTLLQIFPGIGVEMHREKRTVLDTGSTKLPMIFSRDAMKDLEKAKMILSHILPGASFGEIVAHIVKKFINENQRKHPTLKSAHHKCTYQDPITGRVCGSSYQIEVDHIIPKALGGTDDPSNLRALCRRHNQMMAEKKLGRQWANHWRRKEKMK